MSELNAPKPCLRRSPLVQRAFRWYVPRYLARHFHSVAVAREGRPKLSAEVPLIVYGNHAAWWDPLIAMLLAWRCCAAHDFFAPIDSDALAQYPIFERLGFFGVAMDSAGGAKQFLSTSRSILQRPGTSIWMTPEGKFTDPRSDAPFHPGLGHLVSTMDHGCVLPVAIEYPFWDQRFPEALCRFGAPVCIEDHPNTSKTDWAAMLRRRLRDTQQALAEQSIDRDTGSFEVLVTGRAGVSRTYDLGRRLRCWFTGRQFHAEHRKRRMS